MSNKALSSENGLVQFTRHFVQTVYGKSTKGRVIFCFCFTKGREPDHPTERHGQMIRRKPLSKPFPGKK